MFPCRVTPPTEWTSCGRELGDRSHPATPVLILVLVLIHEGKSYAFVLADVADLGGRIFVDISLVRLGIASNRSSECCPQQFALLPSRSCCYSGRALSGFVS